jgi:hypothetical protein
VRALAPARDEHRPHRPDGGLARARPRPIDLLRAGLLVAAVVALASGNLTGAGYLGIGGAVAWAVRPVLLPRVLDLAFVLALCVQGAGEGLGLYDTYAWFDRVVPRRRPHARRAGRLRRARPRRGRPDPRDDTGLHRRRGIFILTVALGVAIGAVWEIAEWASDAVLGSNLSEGNDDTVGDLVADTVGSCIGAGLLVLWTVKGWGSVRRIPGTNEREATDA